MLTLVFPNLYDFVYSVEHKRRAVVLIMKVIGSTEHWTPLTLTIWSKLFKIVKYKYKFCVPQKKDILRSTIPIIFGSVSWPLKVTVHPKMEIVIIYSPWNTRKANRRVNFNFKSAHCMGSVAKYAKIIPWIKSCV